MIAWPLMIASAALVLLGPPLWLEKVPPNRFYGFRTPRTVSDPRTWYPVNRVAGRDLTLAGIASLALAFGLPATGIPLGDEGVAVLVMSVPLLIALVHSFWWASAYVAELDRPGSVARSGDSKLGHEAQVRRGTAPPRTPEDG
ncbi:MAG: SdpI family protein [Alphaproteobacteria bacterium]|nr:SdpI family protein [Alphaproteobacteria bacterium]